MVIKLTYLLILLHTQISNADNTDHTKAWKFKLPSNGSTITNGIVNIKMIEDYPLPNHLTATQICLQFLSISNIPQNYDKACFSSSDYQWKNTVIDLFNQSSWIGVEASGWSLEKRIWTSSSIFYYNTTYSEEDYNRELLPEPADVEDVFGLDKIISIVAPRSESINNAKNLHLKVTTGELFEKVYKVCTQLNAGSIHKEVCYVNPGKTTLLDWEYDDIVDTNGVVGDFIFIVRGYDESDVMVVERRCRFKVQ